MFYSLTNAAAAGPSLQAKVDLIAFPGKNGYTEKKRDDKEG